MIKYLIIEDEQLNMRMLQDMIQALRPDWICAGNCESVAESVEMLSAQKQPDLIFLDIQLTDGVCFSIFENVHVKSRIIFTTAYDNYAIKAFKVNSIDYLLKPVKSSDLKAAILKYEDHASYQHKNAPINYEDLLNLISEKKQKYKTRFMISDTRSYFKVDVNNVAYFHIMEKTTFLVTKDNKEYVLDSSMEKLGNSLDPDIFFRANRNCIIHIDSIQKFEDYFNGKLLVSLRHPFRFKAVVSRLKASAFKEWFGK